MVYPHRAAKFEQWGIEAEFEALPPGYPRFAALLASHRSFLLCRRFSTLRTRLLLLKQDRLAILEKQLRRDANRERHAVISKIDGALADYDSFLERQQRAMTFEAAPHRAVTNLRNWVHGNGCLARAETAYLEQGEDLVSVTTQEDNAMSWLEALVEHAYVKFGAHFQTQESRQPSRDPNVHIFPPSSIGRAVRILLAPFIAILLLTPVVICNFVGSLTARLIIVIFATSGFITVLSSFSKARTIELTVAGATYTTVLVVFISSTAS
ncbi:hypothetical protein HZ326_16466 [Fusarium oxysporum f. sp. albedinis]|nr:hypothetical protein HZ326_26642 [Fusarium oxysporum f. sp. albedinis]KAJ0140627.1 hypothetical protein HZ326_16466 [Fusarium oxysporum f. sp. albedinis]